MDPLSPDRATIETTVDIAENQKGVSYAKLFGPYLAGARDITLVDPYIRYDYQIHNLINFCECIAPAEDEIRLTVLTNAGSTEDEVELSAKLDEVQASLEQDKIKIVKGRAKCTTCGRVKMYHLSEGVGRLVGSWIPVSGIIKEPISGQHTQDGDHKFNIDTA